MRIYLFIFALVLVGLGFLGVSFYDFSLSFYEYHVLGTPKVDSVVVLTGGRGRLKEAIDVFYDLNTPWLVISGVGPAATLQTIYTHEDLENIDKSHVILERKSTSTHENAIYVKEVLSSKKVRSILLITSNYHMRRALFVFREVFPQNVRIIPYAIESENFGADSWWFQPRALQLASAEYLKYLWYQFLL